jgi:hypothetical protein
MQEYHHTFHIPVMGTGHSADTPLRVAPFGITSVISLVDDILLERIRRYYSDYYGLPQYTISANEEDGRAKRITAYLDTVKEVVRIKFEAIKNEPFFANNDKKKYFDLLPDDSFLKKGYQNLLGMSAGPERDALENELTDKMRPGSIDVNIMVKLDRINHDKKGKPLSEEFSDAKAALRGFANSSIRSSIVFSAGINQSLYNYMTQFRDFYRDAMGEIKKRIVLKVSDFRSALIQGKYLAKKGFEVFEFRIESGLNCGGHAFPSNGSLLPSLLQEVKEKKEQLVAQFQPLIQKYYEKMGWEYPESARKSSPLVTVQGGIGTHGEVRRLREYFGMNLTGWATPFLLVPEATCVDDTTLEALMQAGEKDLYVSEASPLNVSFNNLYTSKSATLTRELVAHGKPGSSCPKGFLKFNTEFTDKPICLASSKYLKMKLKNLDKSLLPDEQKKKIRDYAVEKECICHNLGNGALIALGLVKEKNAPQSICPGPNLAWFNRIYTLQEMVDHIYGRIPSLVPAERPHMFAKEIVMYVDYFKKMVDDCSYTPAELKNLEEYKSNLEKGMQDCLKIAQEKPYPDENLNSIPPCVKVQKTRLQEIYAELQKKLQTISATASQSQQNELVVV